MFSAAWTAVLIFISKNVLELLRLLGLGVGRFRRGPVQHSGKVANEDQTPGPGSRPSDPKVHA